MSTQSPSATVIEVLADSLEAASAYDPGDAEKPAAVLWTDTLTACTAWTDYGNSEQLSPFVLSVAKRSRRTRFSIGKDASIQN